MSNVSKVQRDVLFYLNLVLNHTQKSPLRIRPLIKPFFTILEIHFSETHNWRLWLRCLNAMFATKERMWNSSSHWTQVRWDAGVSCWNARLQTPQGSGSILCQHVLKLWIGLKWSVFHGFWVTFEFELDYDIDPRTRDEWTETLFRSFLSQWYHRHR